MPHTAAIPGTDPVLTVPGAAGAKKIHCSQGAVLDHPPEIH